MLAEGKWRNDQVAGCCVRSVKFRFSNTSQRFRSATCAKMGLILSGDSIGTFHIGQNVIALQQRSMPSSHPFSDKRLKIETNIGKGKAEEYCNRFQGRFCGVRLNAQSFLNQHMERCKGVEDNKSEPEC